MADGKRGGVPHHHCIVLAPYIASATMENITKHIIQ